MAHANPHYDPDCGAVHDRHAAERARAQVERDRLIAASAMATDAYQRAKAEFDRHHQACLATFRTRHATVQEYAEWLFGNFLVDSGDWEGGIPVPMVDLAALRSVEEADAAWSRVQRIVSDSAAERCLSLPVGQPEGLRAFANPLSPTLTRTWREFSPRELYPTGYTGGAGTCTLVTAEEQPDGLHICFMHDWNSVGVSVTNAIERLATAIRREACALAEQQASAAGGARGAAGAPIQQRLGAVFAVAVQPAHHGLRVAAGACCDVGGAGTLCNIVEGKEALAAASMRSSQGQAAQIRQRLPPTFMINS